MKRFLCSFFVVLFYTHHALATEPTPADLLKMAQAEQPAFIKTWETLVNIDSGTGYAPGLSAVETELTQRLKALGAEVEVIAANPSVGNNIVGTFKGKGTKQIMLMIHYDTVFLEGEAKKRPFRVDANKAYGPGVADAKGGVVMILHAIKLLNDLQFDQYGTLTVFFNPDEETGSLGSRELIQKLAAQQDYVLSFEAPEQEVVTVGTNGVTNIHLTVKGKASHAGSAPEQGRNALIEAAHQILQLNNLGDPAKGTTVNWTVMQSGDKANVIPDLAEATADMRMSDSTEVVRVQKQADEIIKKQLISDTEVSIWVEQLRPPFARNSASEKLAEQAQAIFKDIGEPLNVTTMRFGTDASYAFNPDATKPAVLETLGIVGAGLHSADEYAELDSIAPRLYLAVRMIQELSSEK
jgi:glutamate carboxypeptidase